MIYRFDQYAVDDREFRLSVGGAPVPLEPKSLRLLLYLLENRNRLVRKQELLDKVWPEAMVTENALTRSIGQLRRALNDDSHEPKFIETVPTAGYRFIAEVGVTEEAPLTQPELTPTTPLVSRRGFVWTAGAAAVVGGGVWLGQSLRRKTPPSAINVVIPLPDGTGPADPGRILGPAVVAPDGSAIVFALTTDGVTYLYVRRLDTNRLIRMEGTEHSSAPFWSSDSQHIGLYSGGRLKRVPAVGGSVVDLCDASDARGASWSRDGVILFGSAYDGIFRVPESGGKTTRVTQVDQAAGELFHAGPVFLPDGNRFLYFALSDNPDNRGVYLESLDRKLARRRILVADGYFNLGRDPVKNTYYLLSEQAGKIAAQIFDVDRAELSGPSRILLDRAGQFSVSNTGVLVIRKFGQEMLRLVWRDRSGRELGTLGTPADYEGVHLSPNGKFAVITKVQMGQSRLWIASLSDGLIEPFSDSIHASHPIWSPDSATVYYNDNRQRKFFRRTVSPRGAEEVELETAPDKRTYIEGISPNQRYMVAELVKDSVHSEAAWIERNAYLKTNPQWHFIGAFGGWGIFPSFSPDGRWLAFASQQTGDHEIYVKGFPDGSQRRISTRGGLKPRWRRDSKELFYIAGDGSMMSVKISGARELITAKPERLFDANLKLHLNYDANYDVTSDGQRFLTIEREKPSGDSDIQMVVNWPSLLSR